MKGIETTGGNMLAYDFLKENPQQNARLIADGWRDLFTDATVPYGVKQQLLQFSKLDLPFSDRNLYFYDKYTMLLLFGKLKTPAIATIGYLLGLNRFCDTLYSSVQQDPDTEDSVFELFLFVSGYDNMFWLIGELTKEDCKNLIPLWLSSHGDIAFSELIFAALRGNEDYRSFTSSRFISLFEYMTLDFIRSSSPSTICSAMDLFRDVMKPLHSERFASLNAIEKVHDAETERVVERLLRKAPEYYCYNKVFEDLVKSYGFTLPDSKAAFIKRGVQHSNCVAQYAERHSRNSSTTESTRLIFAKDATCELHIEHAHEMIVATSINQYKGRHNKDMDIPVELTKLRIALTGRNIEIIRVTIDNKGDLE
jgi:hypothetical protein